MSVTIEHQIESLLLGQGLEINDDCRTIHNSEFELGSSTEKDLKYKDYTPVCQQTVTYIVIAVIINEKGQLLMIQEAKESCRGQWYLPAGRVESNESLVDAVKREVLEETGLIFEPRSVILVETVLGNWFRFAFTGKIIGGQLKMLEQEDMHSMQAEWAHSLRSRELRCHDIIRLVEKSKAYIQNKTTSQHPPLLPVTRPVSKLLLQLVITSMKKETNKIHVLVSDTMPNFLPMCIIVPNQNMLVTVHSFMMVLFGIDVKQHKPHGVLSVECSGGSGPDGICITLLVSFRVPLEEAQPVGKYIWHELPNEIAASITERLPKNMTVPFFILR